MKVVGNRGAPRTPAEAFERAAVLEAEANVLNPFPRERGFVFKARTWEDYAHWRRNQTNPRFW